MCKLCSSKAIIRTNIQCSVNVVGKQWLLVFSGLDYRGIRVEPVEARARVTAIRRPL